MAVGSHLTNKKRGFTMKKVFLPLVLALLIAGGAFAQRVGDTVQVFGGIYRVQEAKDGSVLLQLVSLDGVWQYGARGGVFSINGRTGVFTEIDPSAAWQDAINKGYVKVGDQLFKNLTNTGDLTWTGECIFLDTNRNVATGTRWENVTITLAADGQTFRMRYSGGNMNYTRRQ
jgi:hypothetical protein